MKLFEYQGKALFKKGGIPIPRSVYLTKVSELTNVPKSWKQVMVKAQVLHGKRGKAGLIKRCKREDLQEAAKSILKKAPILIEEALNSKQEHYLSIIVDRDSCQYRCIYSKSGGMDIEELAKSNPKAIKQQLFYDIKKVKLPKRILPIAKKLFKVMQDTDAQLVEINPLIETPTKLIAADAKVTIDANALFRHPNLLKERNARLSRDEQKAKSIDVHYIPLEGDIGLIGNGAGLVMASIDLLKSKKLEPADFLDVRGGGNDKAMYESLKLVWKQKPRGILINIFGGITHCDLIAKGIVKFTKQYRVKVPVVVRMIGTNEDKAKEILREHDIIPVRSLDEGINKLVKAL